MKVTHAIAPCLMHLSHDCICFSDHLIVAIRDLFVKLPFALEMDSPFPSTPNDVRCASSSRRLRIGFNLLYLAHVAKEAHNDIVDSGHAFDLKL